MSGPTLFPAKGRAATEGRKLALSSPSPRSAAYAFVNQCLVFVSGRAAVGNEPALFLCIVPHRS